MAEINKIKVGETTYGINPSWATGDGVDTDIQIGGQNKYLTIGTHGPITMSTAVKITAPAILYSIDVANKALYVEGSTITIGSSARGDVSINGNLLINGNPIPDPGTLGTIQKFVEVLDARLYLGTPAKSIQIGTGESSINLGTGGNRVQIGVGHDSIKIGTGGELSFGTGNYGIKAGPNLAVGSIVGGVMLGGVLIGYNEDTSELIFAYGIKEARIKMT